MANGLAITVQPLDENGDALDKPSLFLWTLEAIAKLEAESPGGAMAHVGAATAREVRKALSTVYPRIKAPSKKLVLPNG